MASMRSGLQLWSCSHAVEVLLEVGARVDVIDSLRYAASLPLGTSLSGDDAAKLMLDALSSIVQMPPTLPVLAALAPHWSSSNYALTADQRDTEPLRTELEVRRVPAVR